MSRSGHCFTLRDIRILRLLKSLRYASMRSLQPMRKAQSRLAEYQADSRHNWVATWRREWSTVFRTTNSHYWASDSAYAETAKRVHTSPPGHKTVWTHIKNVLFEFLSLFSKENTSFCNITLYFSDTCLCWKIQWTFPCADCSCLSYQRCVWTLSQLWQ